MANTWAIPQESPAAGGGLLGKFFFKRATSATRCPDRRMPESASTSATTGISRKAGALGLNVAEYVVNRPQRGRPEPVPVGNRTAARAVANGITSARSIGRHRNAVGHRQILRIDYFVNPRGKIIAQASATRRVDRRDLDLEMVREVRELWQFSATAGRKLRRDQRAALGRRPWQTSAPTGWHQTSTRQIFRTRIRADAAQRGRIDRCFFCYDAPCYRPVRPAIDIPSFIRKIARRSQGRGPKDILTQKHHGLGGARVCPTRSCARRVRAHRAGRRPVRIGALQRYATTGCSMPGALFKAGPASGKKVRWSAAGRRFVLCTSPGDARPRGHRVRGAQQTGGLNEYGVAAYKVAGEIAQREVDYLLAVGNIRVETEKMLGGHIELAKLRREYDAVFLGMGLAGVNGLGIDAENVDGVYDAIGYIGTLRPGEGFVGAASAARCGIGGA